MSSSILSTLSMTMLAATPALAAVPTGAAPPEYGVCVHCHGAHGEGRPELGTPRIGDLEAGYVGEQLRAFRDGRRGAGVAAAQAMVAVARGLPGDEVIDRLAAHVSSLDPEHRVRGPAKAGGAALYRGCQACHGAGAAGNAAMKSPPLVFQDAAYLRRQLKSYRDGTRGGAGSTALGLQMAAFAKGLTDAQIGVVVEHIGSLRPAPPPLEHYAVTVDRQAGLAAFADIYATAKQPRCLNCHPAGDAPLQTEASTPHELGVTRFSPFVGLHCMTCHAHQPVGDGRAPLPPADAIWSLAPKQMAFEGRTPRQLCEQLKDPARNGGRGLVAVTRHVHDDHLLITSWHMGRPPPRLSHAEVVERFETWGRAGGPCPNE